MEPLVKERLTQAAACLGPPLLLHGCVCFLALPSLQAWLRIYTSFQCLPHTGRSLCQPEPWSAMVKSMEQPGGVWTCHRAHVTLLTLFTKHLLLARNRDRSLLRGTKLQWVQLPPSKGDLFFSLASCFNKPVGTSVPKEEAQEASAAPAVWTETLCTQREFTPGAFLVHLLSCRTLQFTREWFATILWQKEYCIRQHHSNNLQDGTLIFWKEWISLKVCKFICASGLLIHPKASPF